MFEDLVRGAASYYGQRISLHGRTAAGADWNSTESQNLRFRQLLTICEPTKHFSLTDYGCGYGALLEYLSTDPRLQRYQGYDASVEMIEASRSAGYNHPAAHFSSDWPAPECDYTVASGVFNVKQDATLDRWREYVLASLHEIDSISTLGFSFNMLTEYSDRERMQERLFYASPTYFFDYAKRHFAKDVYLLHDYGLYEFTIGVRKSAPPPRSNQ